MRFWGAIGEKGQAFRAKRYDRSRKSIARSGVGRRVLQSRKSIESNGNDDDMETVGRHTGEIREQIAALMSDGRLGE